jgi:hypothetical protein
MPERSSVAQMEVSGVTIQAFMAAMALVSSRAKKILAAHGIESIEKDRWYPMPQLLEAYSHLLSEIGPNTTRAAGRKLPDIAGIPPHIKSLEEALDFVNTGYRMNHRGIGNIGSYSYASLGERKGRMISNIPYPCELDEGLLEALGEKYRPQDSLWVRVEHQPGSCRKSGGSSCTYNITW